MDIIQIILQEHARLKAESETQRAITANSKQELSERLAPLQEAVSAITDARLLYGNGEPVKFVKEVEYFHANCWFNLKFGYSVAAHRYFIETMTRTYYDTPAEVLQRIGLTLARLIERVDVMT